ncbi:cupin domain-containing protein [Burkholderia multivorans]|nr:cupin domain-containing protein [Burkholderia multivorans]
MLNKTSPSELNLQDDAVTRDAQFFEYTSSANPIGAKLISRVPYHSFVNSLYDSGPTRVVPLDLSSELGVDYPATGPSLMANFVRIVAGEKLSVNPNATSQVFYVLEGSGTVAQDGTSFRFAQGDFFSFPGGAEISLEAVSTARLYYVTDAPLLSYLGADFAHARFTPTLYSADRSAEKLAEVLNAPGSAQRNRVSILLGNANFPQTRTVTHSMWAMLGVVPAKTMQKPHRHQSIALDFIPNCKPGVYTLVGTKLDENGDIVDPVRVDWTPGMAFVTPPGYWHAHFNESDEAAHVIPLQDAGLQTYLRSLDIQFAR